MEKGRPSPLANRRWTKQMIDLLTATQIAGILGNATNIVDKIYDRFFKIKSGKEPDSYLRPEHSAIIRDEPSQGALVSKMNGQEFQTLKYEELATKLEKSDFSYIKAREQAMEQHKAIWESVYPTLPLESGVHKAQIELQLKQHTDALGKELAAILDFLRDRCGVILDDHYSAFHDLAMERN
jgi:hypothetical protein